ncbi:MAG TPA: VOC family protein [Aliidongia sp.]|uniref:VOC family protein n=1 Tax=Aliidongia sp. TaxID=1914230 RepID=UPI002DDD125B|nr:VOC family protein [Aliidongia sp.]HEV2675743.1 VOC family protein [Aliidongia sp.]
MAHGILGIDHTLVGVADLDQAAMAWTKLGFTLSPRGRHIGWGTANYCVMFERDYIELLGILDPTQFVNGLDGFLAKRGEGLMGFAYASADNAATRESLVAAGLAASEPKDLARQLELPEGTALPRFKLVFLAPETAPGVASFVTEHLTPELLRRPEWLVHANGAVGLKGLTIAIDDPVALVPAYERLFGPQAVNRTDDIVTVHAGRHTILFANRWDLEALHPELELPEGEVGEPRIVMMTLASSDLERTIDHLTFGQIEFEQRRGHAILVPGFMATGAALEFVAA